MTESPKTIEANLKTVACDGGGTLGHPKVYLEMGDRSEITCPYCSRHFVLKKGEGADAVH